MEFKETKQTSKYWLKGSDGLQCGSMTSVSIWRFCPFFQIVLALNSSSNEA